jgi:hypothetical protein
VGVLPALYAHSCGSRRNQRAQVSAGVAVGTRAAPQASDDWSHLREAFVSSKPGVITGQRSLTSATSVDAGVRARGNAGVRPDDELVFAAGRTAERASAFVAKSAPGAEPAPCLAET